LNSDILRSEGGCHCGNLAYLFEASAGLDVLGLRACMCSFCRAHGARNTSDPHGAMRIRVRDAEKLVRYRFGLKTADFLICADCGVYIGAYLPADDGGWMTVNVNSFRVPPPLDFPIVPHDFDAEDLAARIARRKAKWTPVAEFAV
jgi:hypothetical protein